ncbi:hypothetical protein V495_04098 [Pseudogymnoascus sp. VKM F-4514 (FW-929)]|nr:hypothetical protein V495_04098 [Pseudogymnoascus sp. VKM F-4514 (FW-929)]KFY64426.1 hypothetical protein V497_01712 [Pseudogymnoascus sp. VKM F-4516 (FW-969)]
MGALKAEPNDSRWGNVHLRSLYNEAEKFDIDALLRKCITLSSLHELLSGKEPFVPSWLPLDGDTKESAFWIEALTEISTCSNEDIGASVASIHDLLEGRSRALLASHALAQLRKTLNSDSQIDISPTPNINGKRPRIDSNGPVPTGPRSTSPRGVGISRGAVDNPKLPLAKWLEICNGTKASWKDIHAEWNQMIFLSKSAKCKSWVNLEKNWEPQGLTLSLGYFTNMSNKLALKCSLMMCELSSGRPHANDATPPSYIKIVRGLDHLWPATKNSEFESCILEVVNGNFRPYATEELLGHILELARIIKGASITVHSKSQQAELKKAEALCRRQARQLEDEQKEKEMTRREESLREAEEDFGRDRLALDDERASIDTASANLREAHDKCDERGRILAKEASFADRDTALKEKETLCTEREMLVEEAKTRLQKLLLEEQSRAKKADEDHGKREAVMVERENDNSRREKEVTEREQKVRVTLRKEADIKVREEALCKGEADIKLREEALCKEVVELASDRDDLEAQQSKLIEELALSIEAKTVLEAGIKALAEKEATVVRREHDVEVASKAFEHRESALKEREAAESRKKQENATATKVLEDERSALRAELATLSSKKEEAATAKAALEGDRLALTAKQALFEEEKKAWREKIGKNAQQLKEVQEKMRDMQDMQKTLSTW